MGVPSFHGKIGSNTDNYILEHMRARLERWKAKTLSRVGRITLTSSVLNAIPIYLMQISLLPCFLIQEMERICKSFIWHGAGEDKRIHLIKWKDIQRPRVEEGLGICDLKLMNCVLVAKLSWRLSRHSNSLWAQCLIKKYSLEVLSSH